MAVVATGFFDGVHLGHRRIVNTLVSSARSRSEESVIVSFATHPRVVLGQDAESLRFLNTEDEKVRLLKSLGVDRIEMVPFSKEFASLSARRYAEEYLIRRYAASAVVLGYDNRFGSDSLTSAQIGEMLRGLGLCVFHVDAERQSEDLVISSTKIRKALSEGRVDDASSMLGYDYSLGGTVVHGKQVGRLIGFPTANLSPEDPLKLIPSRGVYLTRTEVGGRRFFSMTNVGDVVETNIFDFSEYIYGERISVHFLRRLRDMRDFPSLESLKMQLDEDRKICLMLSSEMV